jgi:YVTN family beta-propeller protein
VFSKGTLRRLSLALSLGLLGGAMLAANASAYALYISDDTDSISVVNSVTGQVSGPPIATQEDPEPPLLSADGRVGYVANFNSGTIGVFDTQTRQPIGPPISAGGDAGPREMALSPDGQRLYVATFYDSTFTAIDLATRTVAYTLPLQTGPLLERPDALALTPDGRYAVVTNGLEDATVWVVDTGARTVDPIGLGARAQDVTTSADGLKAYATMPSANAVAVIDIPTRQVKATIPVGARPTHIDLSPDGRLAFVTNFGSDSVSTIDLATEAVVASIPVGSGPSGLAVAPDGKRLHVVNSGSNTLSTIDAQTGRVVATAALGNEPSEVSVGRANLYPTASFTVPRVARLGAPVPFSAAASVDPDGALMGFLWFFGDGSRTTVTTPTITHAFNRVDTYKPSLTVADDEGCSTTPVPSARIPCYASALAAQVQTLKIVYPGVRVKCPPAAKPKGCKVTLQGFTKKRRGKAETAVAKSRIKAGRSAIVPLKPERKFISRLGRAKVILVKQTLQVGTAKPKTTFRRLPIRLSGTKKPGKR